MCLNCCRLGEWGILHARPDRADFLEARPAQALLASTSTFASHSLDLTDADLDSCKELSRCQLHVACPVFALLESSECLTLAKSKVTTSPALRAARMGDLCHDRQLSYHVEVPVPISMSRGLRSPCCCSS